MSLRTVERHLAVLNGVYWFRRAVPADARTAFGCREVKRSLHTGDVREARIRLGQWQRWFDMKLFEARNRPEGVRPWSRPKQWGGPPRLVSEAETDGIIRSWLADHLARTTVATATGSRPDFAQNRAEARTTAKNQLDDIARMRESDEPPLRVHHLAVRLIDDAHLDAPKGSASYALVCRRVIDGLHEAAAQQLRALETGSFRPVDDAMFGQAAYEQDASASGYTLREAAEGYLAEPAKKNPKTQSLYRTRAEVILEALGEDTLVRDVARQACRSFVTETLAIYPARLPNALRALPLRKRLAEAQRLEIRPLSDSAKNLYIEVMAGILGWAKREGYRLDNPAEGLRLKKPKGRKRLPFTEAELQSIFSAPIYTGCRDDESGYVRPGDAKPRRHRFWIPLISLYSGLRVNEICQLDAQDIGRKKGVWVFRLWADDEAGRTLKTPESERLVPIHSKLIEIGLLRYQASMRADGRLFPDLIGNPDGYGSGPLSKWFSNFLKKVEVKSNRNCFHSLRHTFRDALRNSEIGIDVQRALGGWSDGNVSERYGVGHSVEVLARGIERVSYDGLDLAHLIPADVR